MSAEAYPLTWPAGWKRTPSRSKARYKTTFGVARRHLEEELRRMKATGVILSTNVPLKRNGDPYSVVGGKIADPGVAVYFNRNGTQQVIACDKWQDVCDNLHAVGLTVASLRGIDRAGASEILNRAFTGFKALPAMGESSAPVKPWYEILDVKRDAPIAEIKSAYRDLARRRHPDNGGTADLMAEVNAAWAQAQADLGVAS